LEREQEIKQILLNILQIGILNARAAAWGNDSERCAIEADHIHNLPSLVRDLEMKRLLYYYDISRSSFIHQSSNTKLFDRDWARLGDIISEIQSEIASTKTCRE